MGPVAGRTAPAGVRNRAGPRIGAGKRVVAAVGAGRRARGPGMAQMAAAAVGSGLGRKRAARVLVSCFCKASLDCKEEGWTQSLTPGKSPPLPWPHPLDLLLQEKRDFQDSKPKSSSLPTPTHSFHRAFSTTCRPVQREETLGMDQAVRLRGVGGWTRSLGDARPPLALAPEMTFLGPPPRKFF